MKKIIFSVLVASITFTVNAQEIPERKGGRPMMHERQKGHHDRSMAMKQLNLSEAQKEQFKIQKQSFQKQMEELKKNDNITVKEWRSKMETLRKDHKAKMDGILTSDQKAQLEKKKAEGKARQEEMMKQRSDKMKTQLGLTDEQSAKMDNSRKEIGAKMKAIRENKSLSEEKKRAEMKELMKQQQESMKSILTEEQLKKMKEGKKHRPGPGMHHKGPATQDKETI